MLYLHQQENKKKFIPKYIGLQLVVYQTKNTPREVKQQIF